MTREEYMGELERFAFFYKEMRRISDRIKGETNYAYPIGVELIVNGLAIHLDGSISSLPRMDFVKGDMCGGYREHTAEHNGVKLFYLVGSGESDHVGDQT